MAVSWAWVVRFRECGREWMAVRVRRRCALPHWHTAPGAAQIRRGAAFCAGFERAWALFCACVICVGETDRQTDRQTTDNRRQTDRQTDRKIERLKDWERQRQRDRETETETDRDRERQRETEQQQQYLTLGAGPTPSRRSSSARTAAASATPAAAPATAPPPPGPRCERRRRPRSPSHPASAGRLAAGRTRRGDLKSQLPPGRLRELPDARPKESGLLPGGRPGGRLLCCSRVCYAASEVGIEFCWEHLCHPYAGGGGGQKPEWSSKSRENKAQRS